MLPFHELDRRENVKDPEERDGDDGGGGDRDGGLGVSSVKAERGFEGERGFCSGFVIVSVCLPRTLRWLGGFYSVTGLVCVCE